MKAIKIIIIPLLILSLCFLISCLEDDCPVCPKVDNVVEPNVVDDLAVNSTDYGSIILTWTAPDSATQYDLRYSTSQITSGNFNTAIQVINEPVPQEKGKVEFIEVDGLANKTQYYFALKFMTGINQWSTLSNVVKSYTSVYDARNKIVFSSHLDGDAEIFVINTDGTDLRQITDNLSSDGSPVWSFSGTKIFFSSGRDGNNQLYTMDYNGKNQQNLSNNGFSDYDPCVNSAMNSLVFLSWADTDLGNIYRCDLNGNNRTRISLHADTLDVSPDLSPDGTKIVFNSYKRSGISGWGVFVMDAAGGNVALLTSNGYDPVWSPDGTEIAYAASFGTASDIFVMDADGSNIRQITNHQTNVRGPDWSPDGSKLVFVSDKDGDPELYIIDANGNNEKQITFNDVYDGSPNWSPVE